MIRAAFNAAVCNDAQCGGKERIEERKAHVKIGGLQAGVEERDVEAWKGTTSCKHFSKKVREERLQAGEGACLSCLPPCVPALLLFSFFLLLFLFLLLSFFSLIQREQARRVFFLKCSSA